MTYFISQSLPSNIFKYLSSSVFYIHINEHYSVLDHTDTFLQYLFLYSYTSIYSFLHDMKKYFVDLEVSENYLASDILDTEIRDSFSWSRIYIRKLSIMI